MSKGYSARIDMALAIAARGHRDQLRKGTNVPYIAHPVHVAMILLRHGFSEDVVCAGILHDTVEDTAVTFEQITGALGSNVTALVDAVTEKKADAGGAKRPWRVRKEEQLAHLQSVSPDAAALKAADALHNASSTLADVRANGPSVWARFNASREDSCWYYAEVARLVAERLGGHPLASELAETVDALTKTS
jgi:(p)ppGpp synthase/HD superfamily hydrolase